MLKTLTNVLILFSIVILPLAVVGAILQTWQKRSRKQRALRDYVRRLGRVLRSRYGKQKSYSPAQVKQMASKWGYSTSYDCYGLAMYCNAADFDTYHREIGEPCDYQEMRQEICGYLPFENTEFNAVDVIELGDHINHPDPDSTPAHSISETQGLSAFVMSNAGGDYGGGGYSGDAGGGCDSDYGGYDGGGDFCGFD